MGGLAAYERKIDISAGAYDRYNTGGASLSDFQMLTVQRNGNKGTLALNGTGGLKCVGHRFWNWGAQVSSASAQALRGALMNAVRDELDACFADLRAIVSTTHQRPGEKESRLQRLDEQKEAVLQAFEKQIDPTSGRELKRSDIRNIVLNAKALKWNITYERVANLQAEALASLHTDGGARAQAERYANPNVALNQKILAGAALIRDFEQDLVSRLKLTDRLPDSANVQHLTKNEERVLSLYCRHVGVDNVDFKALAGRLDEEASVERFLLLNAGRLDTVEKVADAVETFKAVDAAIADRFGSETGKIPVASKSFLMGLIMDDYLSMDRSSRPPRDTFAAEAVHSPYLRFACKEGNQHTLFSSPSIAYAMRYIMSAEVRKAYVQLVAAFQDSACPALMRHFCRNDAAFIQMSREKGGITREKAYRLITGEKALPKVLKTGANEREVQSYFRDLEMKRLTDAGVSPQSKEYVPLSTAIAFGSSYEEAVDALKHGTPPPAQKYNSPVSTRIEATLDGGEGVLARDLNRMHAGYSVGGENRVTGGSQYTFKMGGEDHTINSEDGRSLADPTERAKYKGGNRSQFSARFRDAIVSLCGTYHKEQALVTMLMLGQGALGDLRFMSQSFGVKADEHSQAVYEISRNDQDDVIVQIRQPENCPLTFSKTVTIHPDGTIDQTPFEMKRT